MMNRLNFYCFLLIILISIACSKDDDVVPRNTANTYEINFNSGEYAGVSFKGEAIEVFTYFSKTPEGDRIISNIGSNDNLDRIYFGLNILAESISSEGDFNGVFSYQNLSNTDYPKILVIYISGAPKDTFISRNVSFTIRGLETTDDGLTRNNAAYEIEFAGTFMNDLDQIVQVDGIVNFYPFDEVSTSSN
ncbi:hypothetical protein [Penaeicola halotolerans]|uniref:hypothetical protein n=1 Tax=Penaeicola halotolerans TaxID=2793196 RepID=UPI001CF91268|nr:hypothetical protein [Penaeicola halotolerans]